MRRFQGQIMVLEIVSMNEDRVAGRPGQYMNPDRNRPLQDLGLMHGSSEQQGDGLVSLAVVHWCDSVPQYKVEDIDPELAYLYV